MFIDVLLLEKHALSGKIVVVVVVVVAVCLH